MADTSLTTLDPVLKQLYKGQRVPMMSYKDRPTLGIMPKAEDFVGRNLPVPIQFGDGGGVSNEIADAISDTYAPQFEDFLLTRKSNYATGTITGEAIEAAASDKGSFVRGLKAVVDSKLRGLSNSLACKLLRDGTGTLAQVSAYTPAATTITLVDDGGIVGIEKYSELNATTGSTTTAVLRVAGTGASFTVTAVDRSTRTLTSDAAIDGQITAIAANDWLLINGTRSNADPSAQDPGGGNTYWKSVSGVMAWVPASAPGSTAFYGVDRTSDSRLGGLRLDASAYALQEEAIIDACSMVTQEGGACDTFICHPAKFRALVKELGSKVAYDKLQARGAKGEIAHISFRGVVLDGDAGPVRVIPDRFCPVAYGFALTLNTWKLHSLGSVPKFLMHDGVRILRVVGSDSYQLRVGYRGNLVCDAPGWNCIVTMP